MLAQIAAPTLLLRGEFDIMTRQATEAVLPMLRRGSFAEIAGAGHMAQFSPLGGGPRWHDLSLPTTDACPPLAILLMHISVFFGAASGS
jgi:pimeloyl-ACP methyl ester carboxylesterase